MSGAQGSQVFVSRLERLCRLRVEYSPEFCKDPATGLSDRGVKLLDRAIVSTAQDCCDFGRSGDALELVFAMNRRLGVKQ